MKTSDKKTLIFKMAGVILCFALFWGIYCYVLTQPESEIRSSYKNIQYKKSKTNPAASVREIFEKRTAETKDVWINFVMETDRLDIVEDVFQTADFNEGVRFEINPKDRAMSLVIGNKTEDAERIPLGEYLQFGKPYKITIGINRDKRVNVIVNNRTRIDKYIPSLAYEVKDIAVGRGYDWSRLFSGEINDFSIAYEMKPRPDLSSLIFFLLSALIVSLFLIGKQKEAVLCLMFLGSVYLSCLSDLLPFNKTFINHRDLFFDSHIKDHNVSASKEYLEKRSGDDEDLSANFRFMAYSLKSRQILFETSDGEKGTSLKLDPGTRELLLGTKILSDNGYKDYDLIKIVPGKWYDIIMEISRDKRCTVSINGKNVLNVVNKNIAYEIKNLSIGAGKSGAGYFDGRIEVRSISYDFYSSSFFQKTLFLVIKMCFIILTIFLVLRYLIEYLERNKGLSAELTRSLRIYVIVTIIVIGFAAAAFHSYWQGVYLHKGGPQNTFLFSQESPFGDLFDFYSYRDLDIYTKGSHIGVYLPFGYLVSYFLTSLPRNISLEIFLGIFILIFMYYVYKSMGKASEIKLRDYFVFTFLTYPFLFAIDRANNEIVLFLFLALFIYFYQKEKYILSAFFLSLAISMKIYPAIFLILFVTDKKYKEAAFAIFASAAMTLCGFAVFKGSIKENIRGILDGFQYYRRVYIIGDWGFGYGSSLFGYIKWLFLQTYGEPYLKNSSIILRVYSIFSLVASGVIFCYLLTFSKIFWQRIALLVFAAILLPFVSADYKLLLLFIPMFLYLNYSSKSNFDLLYCLGFSFLMIPKNFYFFPDYFNVSIQVIINPIIMGVMSAAIFFEKAEPSATGKQVFKILKRIKSAFANAFRTLVITKNEAV